MTENTSADGAQVQEQQPAQEAKVAKAKATGNLIFDIAQEIGNLTKAKALNQAAKLVDEVDTNYFRLGGILRLIRKEQWFDGHPTFEAFVYERFGFQARKAHYLVSIFENLVEKNIPWEKVADLGWTKLKDLAPLLTPENLDDWVAKAKAVSVAELQALIREAMNPNGGGSETSGKTVDNITKMKFSFHPDQTEIVSSALAKAKGEMSTDHDNVAITAICSGYLSGASAVAGAAPADLSALMLQVGYMKVFEEFEKAFPKIELSVDTQAHDAAVAAG